MPSSDYFEIPTKLRERVFVQDRRVAQGLADPADFVDVKLTGPFLVNAEEEADVIELRKSEGGMYGPVGSADEEEMFRSIKARLLNRAKEKAGVGAKVKQEPGTSGGVPAVSVKKEVVLEDRQQLPLSPRATVTPKPKKRAGPPPGAEIIDLISDDEDEPAQAASSGVSKGRLLATIKEARPVVDSDDDQPGDATGATSSNTASPSKKVKTEHLDSDNVSSALEVSGADQVQAKASIPVSSTHVPMMSMTREAIMERGFADIENVKWMLERDKQDEAKRREDLDDANYDYHAWRKRIKLFPDSFLAQIDPGDLKVFDDENNTIYKVAKDFPYVPRHWRTLANLLQFRSYPRFHTDYTESALYKAWVVEGAGGDVLILAHWLRTRLLETMQRHDKKLEQAKKDAEKSLVVMKGELEDDEAGPSAQTIPSSDAVSDDA